MTGTTTGHKKRVLFYGEAVTLSHVTRPLLLARALPTSTYEVFFARHPRFDHILEPIPGKHIPIDSISSEQFLRALRLGTPLFGLRTLQRYVRQDLEIIESVEPDLVVGDFRQSLAIACPKAGVPLVNLVSAYHSPYAKVRWELADHLLAGRIPDAFADALFKLFFPLTSALHTIPLNISCLINGVSAVGTRLAHEFTFGDYNLYSDIPDLVPTENLPDNHRFIGPLAWAPRIEEPPWWRKLPTDKPLIFISLGSSGQSTLVPLLVDALADLPVNILVATGPSVERDEWPENVYAARFLPGDKAARRSALVVCNGGSTSGQQSLAVGTPFLGIVSNMDQLMFSRLVEAKGAALLLKEHRVDISSVRQAASRMLSEESFGAAARNLKDAISRWDAAENFRDFLATLVDQTTVTPVIKEAAV